MSETLTTTDPADPADPTDDLATLLARREHARPNRVTWVLLVLLVLGVGAVGGAFAEKRFGPASSSTPDLSALLANGGPPAGFFPGGAGGFGGSGGSGAAAGTTTPSDATTGTIKLVDGSHVYVTDAGGNTVTILVPSSATLSTQKVITLDDLSVGDTITVSGQTANDGSITATSLTRGAPATPVRSTATPTATPTPTR